MKDHYFGLILSLIFLLKSTSICGNHLTTEDAIKAYSAELECPLSTPKLALIANFSVSIEEIKEQGFYEKSSERTDGEWDLNLYTKTDVIGTVFRSIRGANVAPNVQTFSTANQIVLDVPIEVLPFHNQVSILSKIYTRGNMEAGVGNDGTEVQDLILFRVQQPQQAGSVNLYSFRTNFAESLGAKQCFPQSILECGNGNERGIGALLNHVDGDSGSIYQLNVTDLKPQIAGAPYIISWSDSNIEGWADEGWALVSVTICYSDPSILNLIFFYYPLYTYAALALILLLSFSFFICFTSKGKRLSDRALPRKKRGGGSSRHVAAVGKDNTSVAQASTVEDMKTAVSLDSEGDDIPGQQTDGVTAERDTLLGESLEPESANYKSNNSDIVGETKGTRTNRSRSKGRKSSFNGPGGGRKQSPSRRIKKPGTRKDSPPIGASKRKDSPPIGASKRKDSPTIKKRSPSPKRKKSNKKGNKKGSPKRKASTEPNIQVGNNVNPQDGEGDRIIGGDNGGGGGGGDRQSLTTTFTAVSELLPRVQGDYVIE